MENYIEIGFNPIQLMRLDEDRTHSIARKMMVEYLSYTLPYRIINKFGQERVGLTPRIPCSFRTWKFVSKTKLFLLLTTYSLYSRHNSIS